MDVELYVYDLSGGMARQYSVALTGVQLDAIYHTAVVLGGVEYFFGQGIHRKIPGSTHHGNPMEIIRMGRTQLPMEVIDEYIQSLESIYTPESYDLFVHNCNNFSQDLCTFLVGKSIPESISSLPETFLKTPIGQMMRGQIDQSMRKMTQAPDAVSGQNARRTQGSPTQANGLSRMQTQTNGSHPTRPIFINSSPGAKGSHTNHPHAGFRLPHLSKRIAEPTLATASPPIDKLLARIESSSQVSDIQLLRDLADHVRQRSAQGSANSPLPEMASISAWIVNNFEKCDKAQFAVVDLLRISAIDPRVSSYLATDLSVLKTIHLHFSGIKSGEIPYNLHFTCLQVCLNLFASPLAQEVLMKNDNSKKANELRAVVGDILTSALLTANSKIRLQAALLLANLAALDHNQRLDGREDIIHLGTIADGQVESALVQAVVDEVDQVALEKLLLALGLMLYLAPTNGLGELCDAMDLQEVLKGKEVGMSAERNKEVSRLLD
jgi:hypothetical protein